MNKLNLARPILGTNIQLEFNLVQAVRQLTGRC